MEAQSDLETPVTTPELLRTFASWGDRIFVATSEEELTYADAEARSAELARRMLALGVGKNTRVAMVFANSADWVITYLAITRIGAHAILLNPFSRAPEVGYALAHSDAAIVVIGTQSGGGDLATLLAAAVPGIDARAADEPVRLVSHPFLRSVWWLGGDGPAWASDPWDASPVPAELLAAVEAEVHASDPMVTSYTSGTTAAPKAVVHSQGAIIRQAEKLSVRRHFTPDDLIWTPMPFFWMGGLCFVLLQAATRGMLVATDGRFDPAKALDLIERYGITAASCWPLAAEAMVTDPSFPDRDLSSLTNAPTQLRGEAWDGLLPDQRETSLGMTETCGPHTIERMDVDRPEALRSSFGRSVPGTEHKIVDPANGRVLAPGELGEVCVRGYQLMQGLYKVEREDAFDRDGYYHTGDAGYFDADGTFFFKARLGDMIKTAGANVTPREVEIVLEAQPEVRSAFVVGVPDPARGQNVAAAVILKGGRELPWDVLRERLRAELSAYKVPRHCFFFRDGELPFTDSGKIDKKKLSALLADRIARTPGA